MKRKLYPVLRDVHLTVGIFSMLFVLMYGWSSLQFAHPTWTNAKPVSTEWSAALTPGLAPREVASALRVSKGLDGDLAQIRQTAGRTQFRLVKPGQVHEVNYDAGTGLATLKTNRWGFFGMMNRMHTASGLWHEVWFTNLFGVVVGLVSLGLLVLGATGLYLWFVRKKERKLGVALLVVSLAWGLGTIVAMRVS
jgi:hypothetical protein